MCSLSLSPPTPSVPETPNTMTLYFRISVLPEIAERPPEVSKHHGTSSPSQPPSGICPAETLAPSLQSPALIESAGQAAQIASFATVLLAD